ncbi:MAG: hypothetical protein IJR68_04810, partial [Fretibacterium sp.]|nr:hypothetical protein [Fretibacterium sp.]
SEHKYLLKLVLSGIHLKIIGVYAIKCLVIKLCEDFLAFHTSFIRVLGINDEETAAKFVAALEASEAQPLRRTGQPINEVLAGPEDIDRLCDLWEKNMELMNERTC